MCVWSGAQHRRSANHARGAARMSNPVVHFEIIGTDGPGLRDFYHGVFDWSPRVMAGPLDYATVAGAGGGIGGGIAGGDEARVTFYVQVDDIDGYLRQIEARGGRTVV